MQINSNGTNSQERKHNPLHVHTAPPAHTEKQRDFVARVLEQAGLAGIYREDFLLGRGLCNGRRISQCGARINELEKMGYIIQSRFVGDNKFVTYFLKYKPTTPAPAPPEPRRAGWHSERFSYGKNAKQESAPPAQQFLSLFDAMTASNPNSKFIAAETGAKLNW